MSKANLIIKNTMWLYAKMAITMFISLYTTRLILNALGVVDFGIYAIVGGAIGMLGFLNGAMSSATQRFMSYAEGQGNQEKKIGVFNVSIVIHLCLALIIAIVLLIAGFVYFNGILNIPESRMLAAKFVYGCLIFSTFLTVINVPYEAVMNAHENMRYYALVGILESLLKLTVALVCVSTNYDKLIVYGILMACIPVVTLSIMKVYCHKRYTECILKPFKYFRKDLAKEMLGFTGWNFFAVAATMIANYGLGIVTNAFYGVIMNTALAIAQQVDALLKIFSNNMLKALNPVIVKSAGAGDKNSFLKATFIGSKFSFFVFVFFSIPFLIETPYILKIWLGNVPDWAVLFCRLQVVASVLGQLTVTFPTAIGANGKIKSISVGTGIIYLFSVFITFVMFKFGYPPYCMYLSIILLNVVGYRILGVLVFHHLLKVDYIDVLKECVIPCIVVFLLSFGLTFLLTFLYEECFLRLCFTCVISCCIFILFVFVLGINITERNILLNLFYSIKKRFA